MPYIEMQGISKQFGTVLANDNACLSVGQGEILALLGENGSGKSTLMNVLAGIYIPDAGSIHINGKRCHFSSPQQAIAEGIGMVHQHFMLIPVMKSWENISLGERLNGHSTNSGTGCGFPNPFIEKKHIIAKITALEERFGLKTMHNKKIYGMSAGEKQIVEILKMLYRGAVALILDEPTAVLAPQETTMLFTMLRKMKQEGCAIIIITHKLNEVMEISDRVAIMRKGKTVTVTNTADTTPRELTGMMVGKAVSLEIKRNKPQRFSDPVMKINGLSHIDYEGKRLLDNVSFDLYPGEILGVAGVAGSGQKELCEITAGLRKAHSGDILFRGDSLLGLSPGQIRKRGVSISFVPEDRLGMGLVGGMSVAKNVFLRSYEKTQGVFINRAVRNAHAETIVERYGVSTPSVHHIVRNLSGGNIQKVLIGREIDLRPSVLITAYPVQGLDINASYIIYDILNEEKKNGVAVLYIGEDLDVLMELCDRLMVIHAGKVMGIVDPQKVTKEEVGLLMVGEGWTL